MTRTAFFFALVLTLCLSSYALCAEPPATPQEKNWFVGPRIGASPYTGLIGLEFQFKHISLGVGWLSDGEAYGIRYYFSPQKDSWYLGSYLWRMEKRYYDYYNLYNYDNIKKSRLGLGGGYRWRWDSGWNVSIGVSFAKNNDNYYSSNDNKFWFMPELAIGYSF